MYMLGKVYPHVRDLESRGYREEKGKACKKCETLRFYLEKVGEPGIKVESMTLEGRRV